VTPERRQDGCVVTAAYVAAGSAMKRAMTGRRMIVGRGIEMCGECTNAVSPFVSQPLLIDLHRVTFRRSSHSSAAQRNACIHFEELGRYCPESICPYTVRSQYVSALILTSVTFAWDGICRTRAMGSGSLTLLK